MKDNITQILLLTFHIFYVWSPSNVNSVLSKKHNISWFVLNKNKSNRDSCVNENQTICLISNKCKRLSTLNYQEKKICPAVALEGRLINFTEIEIKVIDTITIILKGSEGHIDMWGTGNYGQNRLIFSAKLDNGYHI